jgi:ketosteroid isomerase-like protein
LAELVVAFVERTEALRNLPSVVRKEQSMEKADVSRWLDDYVQAWKTYDRDAIGALFSDDVSYRYHPYDEPVRGREAVVSSWLGESEEGGASARDDPGTYDAAYLPVAVDGDVAVATGLSTYYAGSDGPVRELYENCFVLRFDSDGRCREFTEWYMKRPPSESQAPTGRAR